MFISDLFEAQAKQTLVLIPGGYHPFHPGHLSLYRSAEQAFPGATIVYVATDDRKDRPFPFAEKQKLAQIAGVNPKNFQLVRSPFVAKEVTQNFDPNNTVLIFVRSEKDRNEPPGAGGVKKDGSPSYLQPYKKGALAPMSQHGYMAYLPVVQFDAGPSGVTSATQIRDMWPKANDAQKNEIVTDLYPKNPKVAKQILDTYLGGAVAESWDPDTKRLEQDVRDALENGDDYTAKQYAKMAPTPQAKKYLLNIIKQAMYIDDLGGETEWKGVAEMDSQKPQGRHKADGTRSHSSYGSRDNYTLGDPETTLGPDSVLSAKDAANKASKVLDKAFSKSHKKGVAEAGPTIDPGSIQMKKRAKLAHPFAQSDEEALALYVSDREIRDVDDLEREQNRELRMIDRIQDGERKLQQQIERIDQELAQLIALKSR